MSQPLKIVTLVSIAVLCGCQSTKPASTPTVAATGHHTGAVWDALVMSGGENVADAGSEGYRNDGETPGSSAETPDFIDRQWYLTRQYENLRVTNGRPGEYSTTVTRTVGRGPGR